MALLERVVGDWPLFLVRGEAAVEHICPGCAHRFSINAPIVADWLDLPTAVVQASLAQGIECPACGDDVEFAAPLVQLRAGDVIDVLIGLPKQTPFEVDDEWISCSLGFIPGLGAASRIAPVRLSWWPVVGSIPLSLFLAGVTTLDEQLLGEETQRWRSSIAAIIPVPDIASAR